MPLDTILLLDTSGSMAGRGIRELKRACNTFLDGVQETATQTGLKENVAVVEFNSSARIVQTLSNDYSRCRRAIDSLNARGQTGMFDGFMESLKEILEHGGVLRIAGLIMTPRVILMTDGRPTDSAGEEEAKKKVIAAALGFGPAGWRECGLPHPVPIACVGCGDCDIALLQAIAKLTNGMYVIVDNISELSTFFRRQVLLIRFAAQFASDMERLRSQLALAAFLQELGEAVEEAELEAMRRLLLAMLCMSLEDDDEEDSGPPRRVGAAGPPPRAITGPSSTGPTPSTRLPPSITVLPDRGTASTQSRPSVPSTGSSASSGGGRTVAIVVSGRSPTAPSRPVASSYSAPSRPVASSYTAPSRPVASTTTPYRPAATPSRSTTSGSSSAVAPTRRQNSGSREKSSCVIQ